MTTEPSCQVVERGTLALGDFLLDGQLARNHHVAAAAVELDDLDRNVLPDEGIEIVHRPRIGLRTGHESLDADIHGEAALDAAQHAAGDDQLFLKAFSRLSQMRRRAALRVREQDVAFGLLAVVDHDVDHVARAAR